MTLRLLLIFIILFILMSGGAYYLFRENQKLKTRNGELIVMANDSARQATTYRNKFNEIVSKNESPALDLKDARKLEEVKKSTNGFDGVKKNLKNLTQTTKIEAKIDTSFKIPPVTIGGNMLTDNNQQDSVGTQVLIEDGYNYLAIKPTGTLILTIRVPITGVVYWEKTHKFWFLKWGKKRYFSEFKSANPLVKLENSEVIQIQKR